MIGKRIKQARKKKGLTQNDLAELLGVSKVTVCWYESETRTPTMENFEKLIEILDITPDYALGRDVSVVSDDNEYNVVMSKDEVRLINRLREDKKTFEELLDKYLI